LLDFFFWGVKVTNLDGSCPRLPVALFLSADTHGSDGGRAKNYFRSWDELDYRFTLNSQIPKLHFPWY